MTKRNTKGFARIAQIALGTLFLLALAVMMLRVPNAWAQPAAGRGGPPPGQGANPNGMHVFIWSGLKTHGPGQHDYPQFLADWSKVLTEHGAVVDGALHMPTAEELARTDVVVLYKGDVTLYWSPAEKANLEAYIKRGGGLVSLHDSLCGPDPEWLASVFGGGKKHGQVNYTLDAPIPLTVVDKESPLMKGFPDIVLPSDESFYLMTWSQDPKIHVLATTKTADTPSARAGTGHVGEVVPQIWTYEHTVPGGEPARAFVYMEGHHYDNFAIPQVQNLLLRGIAWAGKHPVDELVDYKPPVRAGRGGRGGSGRGGRGGFGAGAGAGAGRAQ